MLRQLKVSKYVLNYNESFSEFTRPIESVVPHTRSATQEHPNFLLLGPIISLNMDDTSYF